MDAADGPVHSFTPRNQDSDSLIETIVIGHGVRHDVELEEIPKCFYPISGKNQTRGIAPCLKYPYMLLLTLVAQIFTKYTTTTKVIIWATDMHMSTWVLTQYKVQSSLFDQINVRDSQHQTIADY